MSNSPLVNYSRISPNKTINRNHEIDTITIHCVVGQCSVETLGEIFASPSKEASSNYGIGADGRIGMYVEEKDRSWCSSSAMNDNRAITIECASDAYHPYAINDRVYNSLIKLCADICKRNNMKELKWKADKTLIGKVDQQNMTVHRWFANKACPGDYIYNRLGQIADDVNKLLKEDTETEKKMYYVLNGKYIKLANAKKLQAKLSVLGYKQTMIVKKAKRYRVQTGSFKVKKNARNQRDKLRELGINSYVTIYRGKIVG